MAQQQKAPKQPQDPYAQRTKSLTSSVQRLRGWVGSDPSRTPELADALVELTEHRLLGHGHAAAAVDAQDAVRMAAQLLTVNGPIGPYTSIADASRCLTALVHVATVQIGMGVPEAAGRTITSLRDLEQQLGEFQITVPLKAETVVWALSAVSRVALSTGDIAKANAHAEAALVRFAESGLRSDPDAAYLAVDVDRLASDCRWAGGRSDQALGDLHAAQQRYDEVVAGRLAEPGRLSPALTERLAEPLFGLYRDLADRLVATGESDLGLVTRRALVELLRGLTKRLGDPARLQLASALADLARDLLTADRVDEAQAAAGEAWALVEDVPAAGDPRLLVAAVHTLALTRGGRSSDALAVLPGEAREPKSAAEAVILRARTEALRAAGEVDEARSADQAADNLAEKLLKSGHGEAFRGDVWDLARGVVSRGRQTVSWAPLSPGDSYANAAGQGGHRVEAVEAEVQQDAATWLEEERAEAHRRELERIEQARLEAERRERDRAEAERAAEMQRATEREQAEQAERLAAERQAVTEEEERLARKRRREERLEEHRLQGERRAAELLEAERLKQAQLRARQLETDPAELERRELERLAAELAELERAEEQVEAVPESAPELEAELTPAPEPVPELTHEPEPTPEPEPEPTPEPEPEPAPQLSPEPDELALARQTWQESKDRGDRRATRLALERVVGVLRPRAQADPTSYGPQLQSALEELSSVRLRSGDVWGSRGASREAKALARTFDR